MSHFWTNPNAFCVNAVFLDDKMDEMKGRTEEPLQMFGFRLLHLRNGSEDPRCRHFGRDAAWGSTCVSDQKKACSRMMELERCCFTQYFVV